MNAEAVVVPIATAFSRQEADAAKNLFAQIGKEQIARSLENLLFYDHLGNSAAIAVPLHVSYTPGFAWALTHARVSLDEQLCEIARCARFVLLLDAVGDFIDDFCR
jgi:hypothetical protein